jgi:hypothetical protein
MELAGLWPGTSELPGTLKAAEPEKFQQETQRFDPFAQAKSYNRKLIIPDGFDVTDLLLELEAELSINVIQHFYYFQTLANRAQRRPHTSRVDPVSRHNFVDTSYLPMLGV